MAGISNGSVLHLGTFNGNPLVCAAALAVLRDVCTPDAMAATNSLNDEMMIGMDQIIAEYSLPAHTVKLGAKGCVTYTVNPVRNYRDYKTTNFDVAYANWIYGVNRGILLPPGLDEQWLISIMHTKVETDHHLSVFADFARELTS